MKTALCLLLLASVAAAFPQAPPQGPPAVAVPPTISAHPEGFDCKLPAKDDFFPFFAIKSGSCTDVGGHGPPLWGKPDVKVLCEHSPPTGFAYVCALDEVTIELLAKSQEQEGGAPPSHDKVDYSKTDVRTAHYDRYCFPCTKN